jgi:hypothetical protein
MGSVKFDRPLGGGDFVGGLFIEQASGNERHHFTLARRELFISQPQVIDFRTLRARGSVPINCREDCIQKITTAERFGQEFYRSGFHGAYSRRDIAVGSNKDDGLTREYANKIGKPLLHIFDTRKQRLFNPDLHRLEIQEGNAPWQ